MKAWSRMNKFATITVVNKLNIFISSSLEQGTYFCGLSGTGYLFLPVCLEQGCKITFILSGTGSGFQILSSTPLPKFLGVPPPAPG